MIEYFKLLIDFGLLIIVCLVQWCIYPSFSYFNLENLKKWHPQYSRSITWIVGPLMIAQLTLAIYLTTINTSAFIIGNLLLVCSTWLLTLFWALPLHRKIDQEIDVEITLNKLIQMNSIRVILWTIIFIWTLQVMTF